MPFDEEELDEHGECAAEIKRLRDALRGFAIAKHVRMAVGGGTVPNGGSCKVCKTEWREGQPESHLASCLLANSKGR